jgi:uncharacterized protein (TIGR01777 family)
MSFTQVMKIAVAGGSGFIGTHLIRHLLEQNDEVVLISRSHKGHDAIGNGRNEIPVITWNDLLAQKDRLEGFDAIVNLSGETINQRWTQAAKQRIIQSRLDAAERVGKLVEALQVKPKVVINGSGMSIYGSSETDTYDERSPKRLTDFLTEVIEVWEQAADDHIRGTRLVKLRVGLVLGTDGGALPKMALPYKMGVGGRVGAGRQWMSWIHIEDMSRLIHHCIEREDISGPVNATAPNPVRNDQFGQALGRAMHRPHWMPVPSVALKLLFGEMSVLVLTGQKVLPWVAQEHGFTFQFPFIEDALRDLY